jgi:RNA polymerase subunit RPABC4/transcription elongation factor Spt4
MPFCRKCGRRLPLYSESCPDCGISTTAAIIKIKKASVAHKYKAPPKTKVAKVVIPKAETTVSVKPAAPTKPAKATAPLKKETASKPIPQAKPAIPAEEPKHEIKQSSLSLEEDIITNPHDYETQTFDFDLKCPHNHFFAARSTIPVSNGKAHCPICGEQLRKPEHIKQRRYRRF